MHNWPSRYSNFNDKRVFTYTFFWIDFLLPFTKVQSQINQLQKKIAIVNLWQYIGSSWLIIHGSRLTSAAASCCAYWEVSRGLWLWLWLLALVTSHGWQVTHDMWHMTPAMWQLTHDPWYNFFCLNYFYFFIGGTIYTYREIQCLLLEGFFLSRKWRYSMLLKHHQFLLIPTT